MHIHISTHSRASGIDIDVLYVDMYSKKDKNLEYKLNTVKISYHKLLIKDL